MVQPIDSWLAPQKHALGKAKASIVVLHNTCTLHVPKEGVSKAVLVYFQNVGLRIYSISASLSIDRADSAVAVAGHPGGAFGSLSYCPSGAE